MHGPNAAINLYFEHHQVMQDSLGGNAKTLMFVNISPADYNQDETVTALTYATRVKLITNTAEKQQVGKEGVRVEAYKSYPSFDCRLFLYRINVGYVQSRFCCIDVL